MIHFDNLVTLSRNLLAFCNNEDLTAFYEGSCSPEAIKAYNDAKEADRALVDAANEFYGAKNWAYGLNYELAEYFDVVDDLSRE